MHCSSCSYPTKARTSVAVSVPEPSASSKRDAHNHHSSGPRQAHLDKEDEVESPASPRPPIPFLRQVAAKAYSHRYTKSATQKCMRSGGGSLAAALGPIPKRKQTRMPCTHHGCTRSPKRRCHLPCTEAATAARMRLAVHQEASRHTAGGRPCAMRPSGASRLFGRRRSPRPWRAATPEPVAPRGAAHKPWQRPSAERRTQNGLRLLDYLRKKATI